MAGSIPNFILLGLIVIAVVVAVRSWARGTTQDDGATSLPSASDTRREVLDLVVRFGGLAMERQLALSDRVADSAWTIDLDEGILRFANGTEERVQVLGTVSGDFLWAHHNPSIPHPISSLARELETSVRRSGPIGLSRRTIPTTIASGDELAILLSSLAGARAYYRATDGGTDVYLAILGDSTLPTPDPTRMIRAITTLLGMGSEIPHRKAFRAYAEARGLRWDAEGSDLLVRGPDDDWTIRAEFDAQTRLTSASVTLAKSASDG